MDTEKVIEGVYAQHGKADADRRKLRGELAVKAWQSMLSNSAAVQFDYGDFANKAFAATDAMLAKLEQEGAL